MFILIKSETCFTLKNGDFRVVHCANHDRKLLILIVMETIVAHGVFFLKLYWERYKLK